MLEEFKKFAMRGNVIDLAVGVIIGAAFGSIVSSLVADIIMPIIGAVTGGLDFSITTRRYPRRCNQACPTSTLKQGAVLGWGQFLTVALNFLIIAWVLFLAIKGYEAEKEEPAAPAPGPTAEVKLLTEIRDLLKNEPWLALSQLSNERGRNGSASVIGRVNQSVGMKAEPQNPHQVYFKSRLQSSYRMMSRPRWLVGLAISGQGKDGFRCTSTTAAMAGIIKIRPAISRTASGHRPLSPSRSRLAQWSRRAALAGHVCTLPCHRPPGQNPHAAAPPFRELGRRVDLDSFVDRLRDRLMVDHPDMPTFHLGGEDARAFRLYLRSIQAP